jgi:hypothetical protein
MWKTLFPEIINFYIKLGFFKRGKGEGGKGKGYG